ncbi:uncharacterized protein LOC132948119 [Metopolophium dirhodum]|uniref:uncharacterized protein LOC132948119 n=1 Tax=Metopolophium dirhodum TaxID=44670 RepID=UPI0029907134|nr:uncharacterized protein LOC132948119 [Metopolophium dirhodum]
MLFSLEWNDSQTLVVRIVELENSAQIVGGNKLEKNRDLLIFKGYLYKLERSTNEKTIWRCIENNSKKCPGRVHVEKGEVTKESNREHNHRPDRSKIEAKQAIENMKKIAKEIELSSQVVLSTMSKEVTESVASKLSGISSMKKTIQRIRQKEIMAPTNPRTLDELVIPAEYKTIIYSKPFLLYDSNDEKSGKPRILIYSTEENLNLITNCNNWYADGTFSSAPTIFYQLYTIHGIQYSNVLPFLFALLPNKTEETYVRLFEIILNLKLELKPKTFMLDFELSTINAIKKVFPNTSLHGCFFHYSQALWRHIQDSGLAIKYREESNFALNIKKLNALSFVPPHLVINAYEAILETEFYIENETLLSDFLDYFESTWIGKLCRN